MNLSKLENMLSKDVVNRITNLNILLIGVGGVGGYALEALVRSGVKNITVMDGDIISESNLNRQILTNISNIGNYKVDEAIKRSKLINKNINIIAIKEMLNKNNISTYINNNYDYIIDAIDDVDAKIELYKYAYSNNLKVIASMGSGNKIDFNEIKVDTLNKTTYCRLSKKIRKELSLEVQKYIKVVYSTEVFNSNLLGTTSFIPGIFGFILVGEIIKELAHN